MRGSESPMIDVGALPERVEAAAPIDAVESGGPSSRGRTSEQGADPDLASAAVSTDRRG